MVRQTVVHSDQSICGRLPGRLLRIVTALLFLGGLLATPYLNRLEQSFARTRQQLVVTERQSEPASPQVPAQLLSVAGARGEKLERVEAVWSMCNQMRGQGAKKNELFYMYLRMCQEYGFIKWAELEEFQTTIRGRGDRDTIVIFQYYYTEHYKERTPSRTNTASHEKSVKTFARKNGYRYVQYISCPIAESQQWDALAKGGAEGAQWLGRLKASGTAVSIFMQRVLALEYLLSDPTITYVLQLDLDVCIHKLDHSLEGVIASANALPRVKRGAGADEGCVLIADMSVGPTSRATANVNAGVFALRQGTAAADFLREWRLAFLTGHAAGNDWNGDQGPMMHAMLRQGSRLAGGAPYNDSCQGSVCAAQWLRTFGLGAGRYSFGGVCLFDQADREQSRAIGNFHDDCPAWHGCSYRPGDFLEHGAAKVQVPDPEHRCPALV
jgi:hypothetical protein